MKRTILFAALLCYFLNAEAQTLQSQLIADMIDSAQGIVSHDFNNDGNIEFVVTQFSQDRVILLTENNGQYEERELLSLDGPIRVGVGDFNLDGRDDILVISQTQAGIRILKNNGDLDFSLQTINVFDFERGRSFVLEDLDNDGDLDLVIASPIRDRISLFEMTSPDFFSYEVTDIDTNLDNVGEVSLGDFDGDGDSDILAVARFGGNVNIYLNSDGEFNTFLPIDSKPSPVGSTTGDYNNDGMVDFAITDFLGAVLLYINEGNNIFNELQIDVDIPESTSIESFDFDLDGDLDLAVVFEDGLAIFENTDPQELTFMRDDLFVEGGLSDIHIFDYKNDGDLDIAASSASLDAVFVFENDILSSTFTIRQDSDIKVYPNPAVNEINIEVSDDRKYITKLFSLDGQLINHDVNTLKINVQSLPAQTYILEITETTSGERRFEKLMIGN